MPLIRSNYITLSLNNTKQTINFKLNYSLIDIIVNDEVKIYYSTYNWESNNWSNEILLNSTYSYKVLSSSIRSGSVRSVTNTFTTNVGGRYRFRLAIYRNNNEIFSIAHQFKSRTSTTDYIDTSNTVDAPKNASLNRNSGLITWAPYVSKYNNLSLKHFILTAAYSRTLSVQRIVSKSASEYLFNNLQPGLVRFTIQAVDMADNKSQQLLINSQPYKVGETQTYSVFDKSSWINKINNSKLKNALDQAANRWNNFIKFNANTYSIIQKSYEFKSNYKDEFKGVRLRNLVIQEMPGAAARCGPLAYINLGNNKFNTIDFILYIHPETLTYSPTELAEILTHELGHALGIGTFWNINTGLPFPYSLNGEYIKYPETQKAYKRFMLNYYPPDTVFEDLLLFPLPSNPKYVPLNFEGIGAGSHWAHFLNMENTLTQQYPPTDSDIMSYGNIVYITPVSIKFLVDIGYEEKNPGNSEYDGAIYPSTTNSLKIQSSRPRCDVSPETDMLKPMLAINASNINNIIIYDENIDIVENICPEPSSSPTPLCCTEDAILTGLTQEECEDCNKLYTCSQRWLSGEPQPCPSGWFGVLDGCAREFAVGSCDECSAYQEGEFFYCQQTNNPNCGTWHEDGTSVRKYVLYINYGAASAYDCAGDITVGPSGTCPRSDLTVEPPYCRLHPSETIGLWNTLGECEAEYSRIITQQVEGIYVPGCNLQQSCIEMCNNS